MPLLARPARPEVTAPPRRPRAATCPTPQASLGNRIVQRLGERPTTPGLGNRIQARSLGVGPRADVHELEADRIARRIVDDRPLTGEPGSAPPQIQRRGEPTGASELDAGFHDQLADSRGAPLDATTRGFMESRFGHDFSGVRIHDDDAAHALSRRIAAQAFTHGHDIYMGAGRHAPGTRAGRELLAHELTHVIQQSGGESSVLQRTTDPTATTTAPTTTTTAAANPITINPQVLERGQAFLDHLHRVIRKAADVHGPVQGATVRASLRGLLEEAYAVGDRRCVDLLNACDSDLAALFATRPPSFHELTTPEQRPQLSAYAKLKKHTARREQRVRDARRVDAKLKRAQPKPWQELGMKFDRAWALGLAKRQVANEASHSDDFNESLDAARHAIPLIGIGTAAAKQLVAQHLEAATQFATLAVVYGNRGASLSVLFENLIWKHVASDLIRHYNRESGLDWYQAPDARINMDGD